MSNIAPKMLEWARKSVLVGISLSNSIKTRYNLNSENPKFQWSPIGHGLTWKVPIGTSYVRLRVGYNNCLVHHSGV